VTHTELIKVVNPVLHVHLAVHFFLEDIRVELDLLKGVNYKRIIQVCQCNQTLAQSLNILHLKTNLELSNLVAIVLLCVLVCLVSILGVSDHHSVVFSNTADEVILSA
jgi:hypothetical protein